MITAHDIDTGEALSERFSRIESELLWRRTDIIENGGWSLYRHLVDTFDVLEAWEQPVRVRLAGLLHNAYATIGFANKRLFERSERVLLEELVGHEGERLIELSSSIDVIDALAALRNSGGAPVDALIVGRGDGNSETITRREVGDLLTIHLARLAQSSEADGSPACWLATGSELASYARTYNETPPPVFNGGTRRIDAADEERLLLAYTLLFRANVGQHEAGASELEARIAAFPFVAEPFIALGFFALASGDCKTAAEYGRRAAGCLKLWNTAWDKRLSGLQWLALADFLEAAEPLEGPERDFLARRTRAALDAAPRPAGLHARLDALGALGLPQISALGIDTAPPDQVSLAEGEWSEFDILPTRFSEYIAGLRENADRPLMGFYGGLTARPWWDPNEFALVAELERMSDTILAEYRGLGRDRFVPASGRVSHIGSWETCMLFERGRKNDNNTALCPATTAIVESHGTARGIGGRVYFARLGPGARMAPHGDATNVRLRCVLGLQATSRAGITVDGFRERLRERRCLVFDGSFMHEDWNDGDQETATLEIDLWHPELSADEVALLEGFSRMISAHADALQRERRARESDRTILT